ncbi:MAG: PEP-CTERM sorting domain-containing protein [Nitrosospira multiformis]|nr:PEP-CTERM sorting domain-containing protein [Nitrosospira multiformis]
MSLVSKSSILGLVALALAPFTSSAASRHDEGIGFYIGYDGLSTLTSGTYAGLSNPNSNRLTLLLDHGNHFHGIGTYSHTGPVTTPAVLSTNTNNHVPEVSSGEGPLPLAQGSGFYAGTLRTSTGSSEYSYLGIASIQSLANHPSGSMEDVLFQSSNNRWSGQLNNAEIGLRLVESTPGLHIGTETTKDIYNGGDIFTLGAGNDFEFKPVYWINAAAPAGIYSATFELLNMRTGSSILDSGTFHFDFNVSPVPEPRTYAMFLAGLLMLGSIVRRRLHADAPPVFLHK